MKHVVIEMKNGKPVVVSCPKKVQVIFREPKRRTLRKQFKTGIYKIKSLLNLV